MLSKARYFVIPIMLLAAASCSKITEPSGEYFRFSAGISDTKVALGPETAGVCKMFWSQGDCISVNGIASEPLNASAAGKSSADFIIKSYLDSQSDVIYPSGILSDGKVALPAQQNYVAGGVDPAATVLAAHCTGTTATLNHACAYVKITVAKKDSETLKTIKLFTVDSTPLSGEFKIDYATATLTATSLTRGYVFVSSSTGIPYADGKASTVFAVPPGNYPSGFAISASTTDGAQMARKSYESGVTLTAGTLYDMPAVQFEDNGVLFSGGSGTEADPYRIVSAEDLLTLSEMSNADATYASVSAASFVQEADINLSTVAGFIPICNDPAKPFTGKYNGAGHIVDGMTADGLFGYGSGCTLTEIEVGADIDGNGVDVGAVIRTILSGTYSGLVVRGSVKGKNNVGGIAGSMVASADVTLSGCRSYADVEGSANYVGGIVGVINSAARVLVDKCAAYGNVKGSFSVGGITGLSYIPDSSPETSRIAHTNCLYSGLRLELTGNNGANGYGMLGGIIGWMRINQDSAATQDILCCASYVYRMAYVSAADGNATKYPSVGGIVGLQDQNAGTGLVGGCFSNFQLSRLWCDGDTMARIINNNNSESFSYGGIYGRCTNALHYQRCYYDNTIKMGPSVRSITSVISCGNSGPYSTLLRNLNAFVSGYSGEYSLGNWSRDSRGCVVPAGTGTEGSRQMTRISVIGDSISTYRSWIPIGYASYYYDGYLADGTAIACDVTWNLTYWGRLACDYVKGGVIEKNISWSGTCVTSCDDQSTKPSFTTRMASSGVGAPDVVLIHGGTNDRNRNLKGTRVDNADGFAYTDYVHQCVMEGLYAKDASALNTAYYADANVKLVKQIHTEHPAAKIVFVIGDRLELAMVDVLIQIADHYNNFCSYVDFRTPGYDNLSKFSGSHPTAAGHGKMAKQIYSEVGTWMETE